MRSLTCGTCGGPLPAPAASGPTVRCAFCATWTALDLDGPPVHEGAQASAVDLMATNGERLGAFERAYTARVAAGDTALVAFRAASAELAVLCDAETLTRVVFGLAQQFEAQHGVDLREHPAALPRLAISYLGALPSIARDGSHQLRIPMVATTDAGPIDYAASLDPARLAELAAVAPAEKKRGLFARFFGL